MATITTEAQFNALPFAARLAIARAPANAEAMEDTCAMCAPHSTLADCSDEELVEMAEACLVMDCELVH